MVIQGGAYAPEKLKANEVASMLLGDDDDDATGGRGWHVDSGARMACGSKCLMLMGVA